MNWPTIALGEVMTPASTPEPVSPTQTYRILGAHWYAQGLYIKDVRTGSQIRAERVYRVRPGQFVYNRLFAWKGSFAVVTDELDGCYVSNEFPCFEVNTLRADPSYLWRYFGQASVWDKALGMSTGGTPTSRNRLKEDRLLGMTIPLPPLDEQRRIVARIEQAAIRINDAISLRLSASVAGVELWDEALRNCFGSKNAPLMSVEAVCEEIIDNLHSTPVYDGRDFPCIRSQDVGWGSMDYSQALRVSEWEYRKRTQRGEPREGDIVYVREGDIGRCAVVDGSQRFCLGQRVMMLRPNTNVVLPRFLMHQLLAGHVLKDQILAGKSGTTSHHVNIKHLRQVKVQVPDIPEQRRIVAYLDALQAKMDALKALQEESAAELDALLPAVLERAFSGRL
jgi:type I restriction enzyme, S subunit